MTSASDEVWSSVASSADGAKLVASSGEYDLSGQIYVSTNSGATWVTTTAPSNNWVGAASSADGEKLAAAVYGGSIYISTNGGDLWTATTAPIMNWGYVTESADGTHLAAAPIVPSIEQVYISTNSGASWKTNNSPSAQWEAIVSSADGSKLVAYGDGFYTTTNWGTTWNRANLPPLAGWPISIALSANGELIAATANSGLVYITKDSGASWTSIGAPNEGWWSIAISADGSKLVGGIGNGGIYSSVSIPSPKLSVSSLSSQLQLSWIVPSTNFVVQQCSDLVTTNWTGITNIPSLNLTNLQFEVTLPMINSSGFYRLRTP